MEPHTERAAHSIDEFCRIVGIGRSRAYEEIKLGRLRALKVGRRTIIPDSEITAWFDRLPPASASVEQTVDQ